MSHRRRDRIPSKGRIYAPVFAALGDETRLALVTRLAKGEACSISGLTHGLASGRSQKLKLSRQAITKHLRVLERAGIVRCVRAGRESLFKFDPSSLEEVKGYLDLVSEQWDQALGRLKSFVED